MRAASLFAAFITGTIFASAVVFGWTGPTSAPPSGNVSAPINVGTTDQVKDAGLALNALAVFGNVIVAGTSRYLNFGTIPGESGYGIRDNAGTMQFKNSTDTNWSSIASIVTNTVITAIQNLSSKFNSALGVPAQGFCRMPGSGASG